MKVIVAMFFAAAVIMIYTPGAQADACGSLIDGVVAAIPEMKFAGRVHATSEWDSFNLDHPSTKQITVICGAKALSLSADWAPGYPSPDYFAVVAKMVAVAFKVPEAVGRKAAEDCSEKAQIAEDDEGSIVEAGSINFECGSVGGGTQITVRASSGD